MKVSATNLLFSLSACMQGRTKAENELIAFELTAVFNELAKTRVLTEKALNVFPEDIVHLLQGLLKDASTPWRALTGHPWKAYAAALNPELARCPKSIEKAEILLSLPEKYQGNETRLASRTGIWPGVLLENIAQMINACKKHFLIISPYWSFETMEALTRKISKENFIGVKVVVITQQHPTPYHYEAIRCLNLFLSSKGATVECYKPQKDPNIPSSIIHAKVFIRDRMEAIIGSANLTKNGMDFNIELGVRIYGGVVGGMLDWIDEISIALEKFE